MKSTLKIQIGGRNEKDKEAFDGFFIGIAVFTTPKPSCWNDIIF